MQSVKQLIAFSGPKRSGKDTCGNYLVTEYGFQRFGFADPLKEACRHLFLLNDDQLYGDLKEVVDARWGYSPRQIMQLMGTEILRDALSIVLPKIGREIFIRNATLRMASSDHDRFVITDLRMPNEAEFVKAQGGTIVKLVREAAENSGDMHASEVESSKFCADVTIINNSTIENLHVVLDDLVNKMEL